VDPALVVVAGDSNGDEARGCVAGGYATRAGHEQVVNVAGNDEQHGSACHFERRFDAEGVEQTEGDVQGFAERSVVVVTNVPGVHYDTDSEPAVTPARIREAGVVARQQPAESGEGEAEQQRLVCRVDQGEQAIAAVGEPVAAPRADPCRAKRGVEQLVDGDLRPGRGSTDRPVMASADCC
jgi:hypothetical protein